MTCNRFSVVAASVAIVLMVGLGGPLLASSTVIVEVQGTNFLVRVDPIRRWVLVEVTTNGGGISSQEMERRIQLAVGFSHSGACKLGERGRRHSEGKIAGRLECRYH
jgi:hypothetical protein